MFINISQVSHHDTYHYPFFYSFHEGHKALVNSSVAVWCYSPDIQGPYSSKEWKLKQTKTGVSQPIALGPLLYLLFKAGMIQGIFLWILNGHIPLDHLH